MNFMRGLADGMDFYRDEKNKDRVIRFLGEYYKSNAVEELEETRSVYMRMTPGLPLVTVKSIENVIQDDRDLSGLGLKPEDMWIFRSCKDWRRKEKARGAKQISIFD